jgi:hypothetical protein
MTITSLTREEMRAEKSSAPPKHTRTSHLLAFTLAALILLLPSGTYAWRFRTMPQLGSYHDDAVYWLSARSLAQGSGYSILHLPERPAQTKYPPLYPALLSLVWRINGLFPENLPLLAALQWSFAPMCLFLAWRFFRKCQFGRIAAYLLTLAIAAGPLTIVFATVPMSELPFTAAMLGLILLIEFSKQTLRYAWGAGLLASAAFLLRSNAIILAASICLIWIPQRKYRQTLAFLAPLIATIGAWQMWCAVHAFPAMDNILSYYTSYLGFYRHTFSWAALPTRIWINADAVIESLARLVFFNVGEQWTRPLAWVVTAAAGAGVVALYRNGLKHYPVFAALFLAMLLVWEYPADPRFLYPLLPLYLAGLFTKLNEITRLAVGTWKRRKGSDRMAAALILSLVSCVAGACAVFTAYGVFSAVPAYFKDHQQQRSQMMPVYRWIAANTATEERFAAYDDTLLFLYSGRRGYTIPILPELVYGATPDDISRYVQALPDLWATKHVSYVLASQSDFERDLHKPAKEGLNLLLSDRTRFLPLYSEPFAQLYRFVPKP